MKFPIRLHQALLSLKGGAHTVIVIHGPREWAWGQVNAWQRLHDYAVVMCPPEEDPRAVDWRILSGRTVLVFGYSEAFADPRILTAALLAADPHQLHITDLCSPDALPQHYEKQGDQWVTWTGLGPREEARRHVVTVQAADTQSASS